MRKRHAVLALILGASLVALPTASASAADEKADNSRSIVNELREFMTEYGVDKPTQGKLIAEYLSGGTWESASSANVPVATDSYVELGYHFTINRYSDGSVNVLRVELPVEQIDGQITTQAISGCSVVNSGTSSARNGCKVDFWYGLVAMSFRASFTYLTPGYDRIDEVYGASWSIGGACSTTQNYFGIQKKYENVNGPARARLEVQAQMCGGYTTTFFLQLTVGTGGAKFTFG